MRVRKITPQLSSLPNNEVDLSLIDPIIEKYRGKLGGLITLLQEVQSAYTYLPKSALVLIDKELNIPVSELYAVATFYAQFKLIPSGKYSIKVCKGTACHVQNANVVYNAVSEHLSVKEGETTADGLYTLESVSCLGCCSLAPAMMIGEETYGKLDAKSSVTVIKNMEKELSTK